MQARQIDLKQYVVQLTSGSKVEAGWVLPVHAKIKVVPLDWVDAHLLSVACQHSPADYMEAADLVGKFRGAIADKADHVLLEEADWDKVNQILDKLRGFSKQDDQMLRRVREAPLIDMEARASREVKEED